MQTLDEILVQYLVSGESIQLGNREKIVVCIQTVVIHSANLSRNCLASVCDADCLERNCKDLRYKQKHLGYRRLTMFPYTSREVWTRLLGTSAKNIYTYKSQVVWEYNIKVASDFVVLFLLRTNNTNLQNRDSFQFKGILLRKINTDLLKKLEVLFGHSQRAHFRCVLCMMYAGLLCVMTRGWELETGSKLARWVVGGGGCVERWPTPPSHPTFYRRVIDSNWKVFISSFCRSDSCRLQFMLFNCFFGVSA